MFLRSPPPHFHLHSHPHFHLHSHPHFHLHQHPMCDLQCFPLCLCAETTELSPAEVLLLQEDSVSWLQVSRSKWHVWKEWTWTWAVHDLSRLHVPALLCHPPLVYSPFLSLMSSPLILAHTSTHTLPTSPQLTPSPHPLNSHPPHIPSTHTLPTSPQLTPSPHPLNSHPPHIPSTHTLPTSPQLTPSPHPLNSHPPHIPSTHTLPTSPQLTPSPHPLNSHPPHIPSTHTLPTSPQLTPSPHPLNSHPPHIPPTHTLPPGHRCMNCNIRFHQKCSAFVPQHCSNVTPDNLYKVWVSSYCIVSRYIFEILEPTYTCMFDVYSLHLMEHHTMCT